MPVGMWPAYSRTQLGSALVVTATSHQPKVLAPGSSLNRAVCRGPGRRSEVPLP